MFVTPNLYHSLDPDDDGYASDNVAVIHEAACSLLYISGVNLNQSVMRWLQVHNSLAEPAEGSIPLLAVPLDQGYGTDEWRAPHNGIRLSQGLTLAASSTPSTYASIAEKDVYMVALWI